MSTANAHHCPDCKAEISPDLRQCMQCGSDVGVWPESQRTPLILPGNPAFSADVVRKRTSIPKIVGATALGASIIGAVLYYMPARDVEETQAIASALSAESSASPSESASVVSAVTISAPDAAELSADSLPVFSYGDTALTRSVPGAEARVQAVESAPVRSSEVTPALATPAPVGRREVAARTPPRGTEASLAFRPPANGSAAATATAGISPSLAVTPLLSNILSPGERLQLRWTVTDRRTGRTLPGLRVEFTSMSDSTATVETLSGLVVARSPGSTGIIIDAGSAGRTTILLSVRAPASSPEGARALPSSPVVSRSSADLTPPAAASPAAVAAASAGAERSEMPTVDEVRMMVDRFIRDVRRKAIRNAELAQFMSDGADHRVTLVSGPTVISTTTLGVRVIFEMRLTKFDSGGRPMILVSSTSMDVDKRNGQPISSAVAVGSLRRP